jgi:hypothetical protein
VHDARDRVVEQIEVVGVPTPEAVRTMKVAVDRLMREQGASYLASVVREAS